MLVQRLNVLVPGKGADQHHQRAFGQVKVGQQQIHHLKLKARGDKDVGIARGVAAGGPRLQRAHAGGAHRQHPAPALAAALQGGQGGQRDVVPLAVHLVLA